MVRRYLSQPKENKTNYEGIGVKVRKIAKNRLSERPTAQSIQEE
ncbi:hypothetical protein CMALT430_110082 [Carnobacterium maltaromaticum]|nr:hypothetical protein [Carnobacterium maltaromaticum]CAD5896735.1 hypothetical protein CMALT430_110082 [Carnobacterium maltaromaticum]